MTRAVRDRVLKDVNGNISDHLRNHIHLTNCIHLKNHMHRHSPILADRALMRDLVVLQRSRSLRDPSATPPDPSLLSTNIEQDHATVEEDDRVSDNTHGRRVKTREEIVTESDDATVGASHEEAGVVSSIPHRSGLKKRRRLRARRSRAARASRNEMPVASNSQQHRMEGGLSIPWNWSRIHHKGKSILDMAGRSLSCGLSESRLKKGMDYPDMPAVLSEFSISSSKSDRESLPLLLDTSGSQRSFDHGIWPQNYSGELSIKPDTDSDLALEGRSHEKHKFLKQRRHQNITQKYMPKTFRDLVGQNLVVQALSNAIVRRKVSFLYLFYGPHGTGKTSCARIFARALNCQSLEHPKPCGYCDPCIAQHSGKSRVVREISPVSTVDFERIIQLLDSRVASQLQSQYRVFIFDECDTLSSQCWSAILKVIDRAPRRVVFVLVCSTLEGVPHVIISRCQKFFFPKMKDSDIIYTLQWIATKEDLDIDKDALKLIASRSDGSLRDAEMTLEQLSLLGKRISLSLVQELVGLISDEKLVELLDSALSADTVNTVKNLREIMESGVEPLALMSQLATVITDILAGSYDFKKGRHRKKFFKRQLLSKDDMERLRQALKTLSEAEKQLRVSNDRMTWLTAALLQLAPDQQYALPTSSPDTSFNHSPLTEMPLHRAGSSGDRRYLDGAGTSKVAASQDIEEIWTQVLEMIQINTIKEFMYNEGKLISVSHGSAPTVQLLFTSQMAKSKAEKFRFHILQAFESVLRSPVTIEIQCESKKDGSSRPILLPAAVEINGRRNVGNNQNLSLVRGKVSLAHVIQQAEEYSQQSGWSRRMPVSIAEKIEQENLRLESRSRRLLCWNHPKVGRRKVSRLKTRTRKPQMLLKLVSCGRCLSGRSPRTRN